MSEKRFQEFKSTLSSLHALEGVSKTTTTLPLSPALLKWLGRAKDVGISRSLLVDRAVAYGGICRLAGSFGLQTVLWDSEGVAHELPAATRAPEQCGTAKLYLNRSSAAILEHVLKNSTRPEDSAGQIMSEGAQIMRAAMDLEGETSLTSLVVAHSTQIEIEGLRQIQNNKLVQPMLPELAIMPPFEKM